jgi:site-specific DNA-methyltransferase (adenine-specific)
MKVDQFTRVDLLPALVNTPNDSIDAVVIISGSLELDDLSTIESYLDECVRILKNRGLFFLQGRPDYLPELGVYLNRRLTFKYWIAIDSTIHYPTAGLPSAHAAVLLFVKGNDRFEVNKVRFNHEFCTYCGRSLRDWGGKSHLMHPDGYAISDIWKNLPAANNYSQISIVALDTILKMVPAESSSQEAGNLLIDSTPIAALKKRVLVIPSEGVASTSKYVAEQAIQYHLPGFESPIRRPPTKPSLEKGLWNVVHHGDILQVLREYPDESIDLAFADPPYNLDKAYTVYNDELSGEAYLNWCNSWLEEYVRVLKPTGSLFVLNLPRWTMYHASFLNKHLFFQNWIVWDALSEPRGKIMPAHYGLLFYTKSRSGFTCNYDQIGEIDSRRYCLRTSCIHKRKLAGEDTKEVLTDIWWDIHRLKHRRDRDYHPCQLPDALMERIIRLTTNEGDIVLDALAGAGTTAVVSARLGRRHVAVEIDDTYVEIIKQKLAQVEDRGYVQRQSTIRPQAKYKKKDLQLELRDIASRLGHLPTQEDVRKLSKYGLEAFFETFPSWGKALKAAKLEVKNDGIRSA